jgi:KaiC/GvpD/RAD55 family RecA-like ATPase
MRLDMINVSKKRGSLVKAEGVIPPELKVTAPPVNVSLRNGSIEFNKTNIGTFQVVTLKFRLKPLKEGSFKLSPEVIYTDELGENKTCKTNLITITVQPTQPKYEVLPGRIPTGSEELDALLFGGIPQNLAVALTSPSTDEKELLITRFLEAGATASQTTFHITSEAANAKTLAQKYPSNFCLFVCNPQADAIVQDLPNVFKLKGVENLTEIDIALIKAFRTLNQSAVSIKRICIDIVSDVLLQHHAINIRRWLSALLPTLKSKGFTILAVINPQMHPPEETQAVLGLFDGEISIYEKETPKGSARFLKVKRLSNQKYLKDEVRLTEE